MYTIISHTMCPRKPQSKCTQQYHIQCVHEKPCQNVLNNITYNVSTKTPVKMYTTISHTMCPRKPLSKCTQQYHIQCVHENPCQNVHNNITYNVSTKTPVKMYTTISHTMCPRKPLSKCNHQGRNEIFYLMTHSTHCITVIWRHTLLW